MMPTIYEPIGLGDIYIILEGLYKGYRAIFLCGLPVRCRVLIICRGGIRKTNIDMKFLQFWRNWPWNINLPSLASEMPFTITPAVLSNVLGELCKHAMIGTGKDCNWMIRTLSQTETRMIRFGLSGSANQDPGKTPYEHNVDLSLALRVVAYEIQKKNASLDEVVKYLTEKEKSSVNALYG